MDKKRKAYAPFSLTSEAGVGQTPVEGYIDVNQMIYPSVDTGVIDENGQWQGVRSSDTEFIIYKDENVPNGGEILTPTANPDGSWPLDMSGYSNLFLGIKPSNGGDYQIRAVMGPDSNSFANLRPVNPADTLRGNIQGLNVMNAILLDSSEGCSANVWAIFYIEGNLANQKLLQFKITNDSGAESTIETAFMRIV
jgi:hypothetical protein